MAFEQRVIVYAYELKIGCIMYQKKSYLYT